MIDESGLRRPTFRDGPKLRLADGQMWTVPMLGTGPPAVGATGERSSRDTPMPFGPEHAALMDGIREAEDASERLKAELALLIYLLGWNYELTPSEFDRLLRFAEDDRSLAELQRATQELALDHLQAFPPTPSAGPRRAEQSAFGWLARFLSFLPRRRRRAPAKTTA